MSTVTLIFSYLCHNGVSSIFWVNFENIIINVLKYGKLIIYVHLKKLAEEKKELQDKIELGKDDIVMVEKPPSNGIHSDDQVSHEEHQQM